METLNPQSQPGIVIPPGSFTLTIVMSQEGLVTATGPIENKVLCYGMLESARDAIKDFNDKQAAGPQRPNLVAVRGSLPQNGRGA